MKRAILFTDIGGSTELYRRIGDEAAHALISELLKAIDRQIAATGGTVLRTIGDAVLAEFETCGIALAACREIHDLPAVQNLQVRAGFHWGDVIFDAGDVYGDAVNLAARICGFAKVGETVMSGTARLNMTEQEKMHLVLLDVASFKGIDIPVDVYRDCWNQQDTDQTGIFRYTNRDQVSRRAERCELMMSCEQQRVMLSDHGDTATVGRATDCDLYVSMPSVSKTHAKIECRRGRFVYTDSSTNGSFVVKRGEPYVFIHRDSITLDASGCIYLGIAPNSSHASDTASESIPRIEFALSAFIENPTIDLVRNN